METVPQEYSIQPAGTRDQFILEYPNGRRVLVEIDPVTGKETFIREL
jgi:hypothetical protein